MSFRLKDQTEADIVAYAGDQDTQATAYTPSASEYRIADIFKNVNVADGNMLKYIPDGFLGEEQKKAKAAALQRTEQYIRGKNRKYQNSYTEEETPGGLDLGLPMAEDTDGRMRASAPTGADTEAPEVKDLGLPKIGAEETEETKKPKTRKKPPKPVADIGKVPELMKLYVEEMNDPNIDGTAKRAYQLQNIEKASALSGGVQGQAPSSLALKTNAIQIVADLYAAVKSHDEHFNPQPASKIGNADGTPKSAIFSKIHPITAEQDRIEKTSFVNRQKRFLWSG